MRVDFIGTLHCPFSGSRLVVHPVGGEGDRSVGYGLVSSEAGDFPVIDGILRLKIDEYRAPLVALVKSGQPARALRTALDAPFYGRIGRAVHVLDRTAHRLRLKSLSSGLAALKRPIQQAITDDSGTLVSTMKRLKSPSAGWYVQRFSMPHFLPIYPLLHLVEGAERVLDVGSGIGHAALLMSRRATASNITCVDFQFYALYVARRFFVPDANFICLDAEYPLPFQSGYFSVVSSSDAVHFIDSKLTLTQEFKRVLSRTGTIILPHLHNKWAPGPPGRSLTPDGYDALFEGMERRLVPEDVIVNQFVSGDELDLDTKWAPSELRDAVKGISLIASRDATLFRRYAAVSQQYAQSVINPSVNPVYQSTRRKGNWELRKAAVSANGNRRAPGDNIYLPDTALVPVPALDRDSILNLKTSDFAAFSELTTRFVLIDTPAQFQ